jgi:integrase
VRRSGRKRSPWVVDWRDRDGRRHARAFGSRELAEREAARLSLDLGQPGPPPAVDLRSTVREYAKHWLESVQGGLKRRTVDSYLSTLNRYVLPSLGHLQVRELHQQHIATFLTLQLESGRYEVSTVRMMYATIRRLLTRARFDGLVTGNVAMGIWRELPVPAAERRVRRRGQENVKAMTRAQLDAFVGAAASDHRHAIVWLILSRSGLRMGEALGLQLGDVDLAAAELSVRRNLGSPAVGTLEERVDSPKSGQQRTVDIGQELVEALRAHIALRKTALLQEGRGDDPAAWLLVTSEGTPLDESRVRKAFKATARRAGVPARLSPHSLRHTYASLMLAAGASLTWVARQLGHSSPQTTLDWYSWALPSGDKSLAALLDSGRGQSAANGGS